MPKTVAIDARWLVGGIGTYTMNLLQGLHGHPNGVEIQAIVRQADTASVERFCTRTKVVDVPIYTVLEQLLIPRAAHRCDLLHVPHFNVPLLHRGPLLVSIMDVIHLSSPAYSGNVGTHLYVRPMLKAAARKAEHVVTVSEYSKNEIIDALKIPGSKITVIPCGVGAEFGAHCRCQGIRDVAGILGIESPYILYVGNLKPHKNVPVLLRAFAQLRKNKNLPHSLLIIGDDLRWRRSVVEECCRLGIRGSTIFVPYVSQELLPKLYATADLLVLPSKVEGFGLPVLEAMACGTPVVASRAASLPEVAGDAALYFDPDQPEELAEQMERILQTSAIQSELRAKGLQRAKEFTWQKSTRRHIELYHRLLGLN
jgi:glycosyltransferase involved in cell wall biosynthesis